MDPKCSPLITNPLLFLRESTRTGVTVIEETVDRMESQEEEEVEIIMEEKGDRGTSSAGCLFCHLHLFSCKRKQKVRKPYQLLLLNQ